MATSPELHEPQIAAARAKAWHQAGDALLTLEAARSWLNEYGLVLFASRGGSLGAPAPSLVEATLGEAKTTVLLPETDTARTLTARLVGEGSAVPLNLLGGPGDLPDFLVSAQAFPFVFTLRGDKGWKRPPETTGAVKVSLLGLRVYELLAERGALTIAAMVSEIGREVTESAIARALTDLWQMLRVVPVPQQGEGETVWELTTARYLKGIKAGANAGQPTALSALASLYLAQVLVASEEEITGFLSPLTARSRVRDVLHGLVAGRQLDEGVVNGKAVLYLPDSLPDFSEFVAEAAPEVGVEAEAGGETEEKREGEASAPPERIRRFAGDKERPQDRNLRGKPVSREGGKRAPMRAAAPRPRRDDAGRPPREDRGGERPRPERKSFSADGGRPPRREGGERAFKPRPSGPARPSFNRPWEEDRGARPPRDRAAGKFGMGRPAGPPRDDRGNREGGEVRPARPFAERRDSGPPRREGERPYGPRKFSGEGRSSGPRSAPGEGRPPRPFRPRTSEGAGPFRPRADEGAGPFRPRSEEGGRPFRPRPEGSERPARPRPAGGDRPFRPRPEGGDRPYRPRPAGGDRPVRPRTEDGDRPFRPREGGAREGGSRERSGAGRPPAGPFARDSRGPGRPSGDRGPKPAGRGSLRPVGKKGPAKFAGKSDRPERPVRKPRTEDEA